MMGSWGAARRVNLEAWKEETLDERAIVNQTNIGTVSKATVEKLLRDRIERIIMGFSERIDTVLN